MPEGDVVLRTARRLHAALAGRPLIKSDLRWPSLATVDLTGRQVLEVVAVGKHLLIRMGGRDEEPTIGDPPGSTIGAKPGSTIGALTLHSHLRMDGSWHIHRTGERWRVRPEHDIRVIVANQQWTTIGHRLGMLDLVATRDEGSIIGHLGPDLLAPGWDLDDATNRVAAHPDRRIGEVLLDQRVIAGIGTFYLSEACFLRGVNPWLPVRELGSDGTSLRGHQDRREKADSRGTADLRGLVDLAHRLMTANVERGTQVTTGDVRRGHEQWVHSRSGRPCRRCRTTIRVAELGQPPNQRVAFWCPSCQPGAVPTDSGRPQQPLGASRPAVTARPAASDSRARTKPYRRPT